MRVDVGTVVSPGAARVDRQPHGRGRSLAARRGSAARAEVASRTQRGAHASGGLESRRLAAPGARPGASRSSPRPGPSRRVSAAAPATRSRRRSLARWSPARRHDRPGVDSDDLLFEIVDVRACGPTSTCPRPISPTSAPGRASTIALDGARRPRDRRHHRLPRAVGRPATRTARARVALRQPRRRPARQHVRHARDRGRRRDRDVMVPARGRPAREDVALVFVQLAVDEYETRRVKLGAGRASSSSCRRASSPARRS
jgi:hypothetical protein